MDPEDAHPVESRPPTVADLVLLCRSLNAQGARYLVIGGFAVNQHGFPRATMDIDLLVDAAPENQDRVKKALEVLPDKAVRELAGDDLRDYLVVRVADEIVVDLMTSACRVTYAEASPGNSDLRHRRRAYSLRFGQAALARQTDVSRPGRRRPRIPGAQTGRG